MDGFPKSKPPFRSDETKFPYNESFPYIMHFLLPSHARIPSFSECLRVVVLVLNLALVSFQGVLIIRRSTLRLNFSSNRNDTNGRDNRSSHGSNNGASSSSAGGVNPEVFNAGDWLCSRVGTNFCILNGQFNNLQHEQKHVSPCIPCACIPLSNKIYLNIVLTGSHVGVD